MTKLSNRWFNYPPEIFMFRIFFIFIIFNLIFINPVFAVSDPLSVPNNKFGINILSPDSEIEEAAKLVNSKGDWGWAVVVIKKSERNVDRWQSFLNLASVNHVIPIFRLATEFNSKGYWQKPASEDANDWADFLSKLYWPTKNRYIQIYNEVNRSSEWGGNVDAADYAKELNKTVDALKAKSDDFFVLNAPLDLALENSPNSIEPALFFQTMESVIPGIFKKLDGWASHSYPNPNFSASPLKSGKTGIDGYKWELAQINQYLDGNNLLVFITETGWKRQTGNAWGLDEMTIAQYFKTAFEKVWNDERIISVSPFVFNYPEELFNAFAFKSTNPEKEFHEYYYLIKDLQKTYGDPRREDSGIIQDTIENYEIILNAPENSLNFNIQNTGNYLWDTKSSPNLDFESSDLEFGKVSWNRREILPGQTATASVEVKAKKGGQLPLTLNLKNGDRILDSKELKAEGVSYFSIILKTITLLLNSFNKSS